MLDKNTLDDPTLAQLAKDGDSEAVTILSQRHSGVYYLAANRYMNLTSGTISQDIRDNQDYVIWQAANTYKPERGQFNSWVGQMTKYQCCEILEKNNFKEISVSPEILEEVTDSNFTLEYIDTDFKAKDKQEQIKLIEDILAQIQNDKVKTAIEERFCKGSIKSYKEAGKIIGVSGQSIKNRENLFIKLARNKLTSEQCCDII